MSPLPPEPSPLPSPPTDGITSLSYIPFSGSNGGGDEDGGGGDSSSASSSSILAASSWDGTIRLYDTKLMSNVCTHNMDSGPLLSLAVDASGKALFTGGLDGSVKRFDIETSKVTTIGHHSSHITDPTEEQKSTLACACLSPVGSYSTGTPRTPTNVLASAGWDSNFYLWDVRMSTIENTSSSKPVATIQLPDKAYSMDVDPSSGTRFVVATAGKRNVFIDVRMGKDGDVVQSADIVSNRESSLKYQTRVCRYFPDGKGIAVGSIEGRVAIEFLEDLDIDAPNGMKKYAFKCHRVNDVVYPVNAIAFHKEYGTFATGGCDGTVVTWDGLQKRKLSSLHKFPTSIAAMCFNQEGTELAIASSYTFEEGERDHPRDEIYVRQILDAEIMPKAMKKKKDSEK